jgi:hypothetical protein
MPSLATRAAVAGTLDIAVFLAQKPQLFREAPGRAVGSAAFGALWLTLAVRTALEETPDNATVAFAGALAAGNAAMLAVHLRHRIMSPRVFAGAALSAVALADVLRRR